MKNFPLMMLSLRLAVLKGSEKGGQHLGDG